MYTGLSVLAGPALEPVTVELARQHLRIDYDDDDNLIATYIATARSLAESYMARALISQQLRYSVSDAPPGPQWPLTAVTPVILPLWLPYPLVFQQPIRLPRSPVISIDRVAVSHTGQLVDQVMTPETDYTYDLTASPARLLLKPTAQPALGQHVLIDFTAGFGTDATTIPPEIVMAVLFGTTWLNEHRGDDGSEMPGAFYALMTPYRLVGFG
jgi:hypothetical protein